MNIEELKKIYYNPKTGFQSLNKLYEKVKHLGFKKSEVKKFIDSQAVAQILTIPKRKKEYNSYRANYPGHIYQIDIMVYDRYTFNKYKYILNVIDIYSRYAESRAMTNRELKTIIKNYIDIIKNMGPPYELQADNEFNKKEFLKVLEDDETRPYFFEANEINKNPIVERFNGTIANILQKIRTSTKNYNWSSYLKDVIYNYNNSIHSTTKNTPISIFTGKEYNEQEYKTVNNPFKIGDYVRIITKKKTFDKGDKIRLSELIYKIINIEGQRISLNGIEQKYKPYELYKVKNITENIHIPKTETKNNKIRNELKRNDVNLENIITTKRIPKINEKFL